MNNYPPAELNKALRVFSFGHGSQMEMKMYPPDQVPDIQYSYCPLDMKHYPDDAWTLLPLPNLEKPPADVPDERLFDIANDSSIHLFWRCSSAKELVLRRGLTRECLISFHEVFNHSKDAALFRALFDLSSYLTRDELNRGPIDEDIVELYIATLKRIEDYRLARPAWLVRAQLGDKTVYSDIIRLCENYKWPNAQETIRALKEKDFNWSYVVERKPLSDKTSIQLMSDTSSLTKENTGRIVELKKEEGDWLTREVDSVVEVEYDKCIVEISVETSGVFSEWLVGIGDEVKTGDPLFRFYVHID